MRLAALFACLLCLAAAASAEPVEVRVRARVEAPPERVMDVLASFESWSDVFRSVETLRVERLDGRSARFRQIAHRAGRDLSYTLLATVHDGSRRVEARLDPDRRHDLAVLDTTWQVRPRASGGSLIELRVVTDSGLPVPRFLEERIASSTTRTSLEELVQALDLVLVTDSHDDTH